MIKRYSSDQIISMVSELTDYQQENVEEIFVALEEIVVDLLLSASEFSDIEIKIIPGISVSSSYIPAHDKRMPDGSIKQVKNSIRFKAKVTDYFTRKKRKYYENTQELWERVKRRKRK